MPYKELARAFDMDGAFNYLAADARARSVRTPGHRRTGSSARPRMADAAPMAGRIILRTSACRTKSACSQTISIGFPIVFLSVAAFMTNAVLSRLLNLQREQIAILKAFGFANRQIVIHYLKFAFVMVAAGTVLGAPWRHRARPSAGGDVSPVSSAFPIWPSAWTTTAFPLALVVSAGAATAGRFQRRPPRRPAAPGRSHAPRTARELPARARGAHRHWHISFRTPSALRCETSSASRCRPSSPSPDWRWRRAF